MSIIDVRFELAYIEKFTGNASCYLLAVPRELATKVSAYLTHHGCKFTGKWQKQIAGRQVFYIEYIQPHILQALAERTKANHGKVSLPQPIANPIAEYYNAFNDGQIETLEKLWDKIGWTPEESLDPEECTYESMLNKTAMHLNDIKYCLV